MLLSKWTRNLIVGKENFIESRGLFRQVMLSGYFALMAMAVCLMYAAGDFLNGAYETVAIYGLDILLLGISIMLHRHGRHGLANYFLLPTVNVTVYLMASSESPDTGAFIFFIPTSLSAFAVFSYRQRLLSMIFAAFTYMLFVLAYFVDFSILPHRNYSNDMLLLNVVVNFTIALPASLMAVYLLITLNHDSGLQLVQSNKLLLKTNNELDRFVYSTSHDLRAPLTSLLGLINVTEHTSNAAEMRSYIVMMRERVHSLDKFIRDITDYSRNNRMEIAREPVQLAPLAQEVWDSLKHAPDAAGIEFRQEIADTLEVRCDRTRLATILTNLIANAIRYHDGDKDRRYVRLQCHVNGKSFFLKVEDNGQGIKPEYQAKVFDMFFRANEKSKGSGLGLYIVKETLVKLAGSVRLESAPGIGSVFTIKLPR